jgi:hypothetical protein
LFAVSVLFKVYPAFFASYFLLVGERRFLALSALWIVLLTLLPLPLIGTNETVLFHGSILPQLGGSSIDVENVGVESLLGFLDLLYQVERGAPAAPSAYLGALATLWRLFVLSSMGVVTFLAWRRGLSDQGRYVHFALCVAALLVIVPVCWSNYQILLAFPLSAIWLWVWQGRKSALDSVALVLSVVVLALLSVPLNDYVRDPFVAPRPPRARALVTSFSEVLQPELLSRMPAAARKAWSATRTEWEDFVEPGDPGASQALARRRALSTPMLVGLIALRPLAGMLAFLAILAAAASTLACEPSMVGAEPTRPRSRSDASLDESLGRW